MGIILDTCVFIQAERQKQSLDYEALDKFGNVYISAVTVSELLLGVHKANSEKRRLKRSAFVENILSEIPVLNFNMEVARLHAEIYNYLSDDGNLIGAHDLIIAATALTNACGILTTNTKEFERVPGLTVIPL